MLAKDLDIARSALNDLRKNKKKIISEIAAGHNAERKRKRQHEFDDVD